MPGPLTGVKVIELQGIGPGPFCGMMLSDMGAEVLRIDRAANVGADTAGLRQGDVLARGRRSVGVDLKHAAHGVAVGVVASRPHVWRARVSGHMPDEHKLTRAIHGDFHALS